MKDVKLLKENELNLPMKQSLSLSVILEIILK